MVERHTPGPLPRAYGVPGGPPPIGDGSDDYPVEPLPEPTRRRYATAAVLIAAAVAALLTVGCLL